MWRYSALLLVVFLLASCERYPSGGDVRIRRDMVDQPSYRPQKDPLPLAEGAVPTIGVEPPVTREASSPAAATPASITQGQKLFVIYCQHCHGASGRGDGPVARKISRPADLTARKYLEARDGLIYNAIRNGGVIMPPLSEALAPAERWRVVDYVRKLQRP
jgi:mono/diheme cytochrome c family protein